MASSGAKALFVAALLLMYVLPTVMLLVGVFRTEAPGAPGAWTLDGLWKAYSSPETYLTLRNSLVYAVSVAMIAGAAGSLLAWISTRTNTPGRRAITPIMVCSMMLPPLYYGFGWINIGNKQNGLLNVAFQQLTGADAGPVNIMSFPGMIFMTAVGVTPLAYFILLGPFRNFSRTLEEASRISGAGPVRTMLQIVIPTLSPAFIGTFAMLVVLGLQAFEIPQLIGRPAGIKVFSTQIYAQIYDETPSQYNQANALALLLMVFVVLLFVLQAWVMRGRSFATVTGKGFRPEPVQLGPVRWLLTLFVVVFTIINPVLPLSSVILGSFQQVFGVYGNLTLANYQRVWTDPEAANALATTAQLAVFGGLMTVVLVFVTAYIGLRGRGFVRGYSKVVTWIPWTMPGIVLSLSFLWAYSTIPGLKLLYATTFLMMLALVVEATPVVGRMAEGALVQLSTELEEAARTAGAGVSRTFCGIVLRLVLPSLVAAWFVAALRISGDLSIPVLLSSINTMPVSLVSYQYFTTGDTAAAAALACTILFAVVLGMLVAITAFAVIRWARRPGRSRHPRRLTLWGPGPAGGQPAGHHAEPVLSNK